MAPSDGRSKSLILDVYGAYARPLGNWLAVADVVTLLGELGVEQQAVRSAVSRMTRSGLLVKQPRDGIVGYSLSDAAMPMMERGDRRIFATREPADLADGWAVVIGSVPETERGQRYQLRKRLTWLGFGNLANGVWIAPRRTIPDLTAVLEQFDLIRYVHVFEASYHGFGDAHALVASAWDIEWLRSLYGEFLTECHPALDRWRRADTGTHPDVEAGTAVLAFVDYTVLLHAWRRLPYLDPGLPRELLPADWEGHAAAAAFFELRDRLEVRAMRFVRAVVERAR